MSYTYNINTPVNKISLIALTNLNLKLQKHKDEDLSSLLKVISRMFSTIVDKALFQSNFASK